MILLKIQHPLDRIATYIPDEILEKLYEDRMEIGQDYLKRFARWLPHIMYAIFVLILLNSMVGRFSGQIQLP